MACCIIITITSNGYCNGTARQSIENTLTLLFHIRYHTYIHKDSHIFKNFGCESWKFFLILFNKFSFVVFRFYKCLLRNKNPNGQAYIAWIHFFGKLLNLMTTMSWPVCCLEKRTQGKRLRSSLAEKLKQMQSGPKECPN